MSAIDSIDNQRLIANGLRHIQFETTLPLPSYFRIAREAHLVLYRAMVEAIKGSANLTVTGWLPKQPVFQYQQEDEPFREIRKAAVPGRTKAWRFSAPVVIAPPNLDAPRVEEPEDRLLGFYDVLAMVQTDCFMRQFTHSRPISVDDGAMATLEWLHESIRNEYEHFVPKHYSASVQQLLLATELSLQLAGDLLFESGNARVPLPFADELRDLFRNALLQGSRGVEVM